MSFSYPEPEFPHGVQIYVSEPSVNTQSSSSVIDALKLGFLSSKAEPNKTFQCNIKEFFNLPTACSVSNGYTGLYVIVKSLKLLEDSSEKNEVILPDATMVAVANSVIDNGLQPILVDNQQNHLNPSAQSFISKVTNKTLAIIVTHTYGVPVLNFDLLVDYCQQNEIFLIEDIAEALGVQYKGKYLGTYGHFASASLYANKLITAGDGGFIMSRLQGLRHHQSLEQYWKCIINHGFSKNYHFNHIIQTGNYRINGLGAAFISNFHKYIQYYIEKRKIIDKIYRFNLKHHEYYTLMEENPEGSNMPWVFSLLVKDKQTMVSIRQYLANFGIQTRPYFKPIHTQSFIKTSTQFCNSQIQYQTGFYLPTYHELTQEMQIYIARCLNHYFIKDHELKMMKFQRQPKKILDLLKNPQIQELLENLIDFVRETEQNDNLTPQMKSLLKTLGKVISSNQSIQIIDKNVIVSLKQQNQVEPLRKNSKIIILRQDAKQFGKTNVQINEGLQQYLANYNEYFDVEENEGCMTIWQRQLDKQKALQQLPLFDLEQNMAKISKLIARQIYNFHQIFRNIPDPKNLSHVSFERKINNLRKQFQIIKTKLVPQDLSSSLVQLLDNISDCLLKDEDIIDEKNIVIAHNSLTLQKLIWMKQQQKVQLYDFQNIAMEDYLTDLAFVEFKYAYIQMNDLVINEYFLLYPNANQQWARNKINKLKAYKFLKQMMLLIQKLNNNAQLRQTVRKHLDHVLILLQNLTDQNIKERYKQFSKKNLQTIVFLDKIEKKFKMENKTSWEHHNGGWTYVQNQVYNHLRSENGQITFFSAVQKGFYDCIIVEPIKQPWCGVIHSVPLKLQNNLANLQYFLKNPTLLLSMKSCVGLYCLTEQIRERLVQQFEDINCQILTYPFTPPNRYFSPQLALMQSHITLLHVGQYLRELSFFKNVKVPALFLKTIIPCGDFFAAQDTTQKNIIWLEKNIDPAKYQQLLCKSILFFYLRGAGGCTTVLECIARNIPVVVNRLKPLEEYLGQEYPLFYESEQQAQAIFSKNFVDKALNAYYYLISLNKSKFYTQNFIEKIHNGYNYQLIPLPNEQKQQFKEYDISILLISYKRQANIRKIVQKFSSQTYKGKIQLIIWNNSTQYSLKFIQKEFKTKFANTVVIQSTFNYYCYVRSAIANLARGKLLMFSDDDIFPCENFITEYINQYQLSKGLYPKNEVVATLKGNVFHSFHPKNDINFWTNFDNIHFINSTDESQLIDIIHMDTCLMERSLMIKCTSYQIPELDYILVDDYWYSFVLSNYLNAKIVKIKPATQIFQQCPSCEDANIALYKQSKTTKQKNRFFCYHAAKNWPLILSKDHFNQVIHLEQSLHHDKFTKIKVKKSKQSCFQVYQRQFSGFNISSVIWQDSLYPLVFDFRCKVVRVGIVDLEKEFLSFYMNDGVHIVEQKKIKEKLMIMNNQFERLDLKYIITLGNIPGKNQYIKQSLIQRPVWYSKECLQELTNLWKIITKYLADCPNCIGYDLINEPNPDGILQVQKLVEIYVGLIAVIRQIDNNTPIILQPFQAGHKRLASFIGQVQKSCSDNNLIYSFHFYDPYVWTSARQRQNEANYQYPGPIPEESGANSNWSKNTKYWDKQLLNQYFLKIHNLYEQYNLKPGQILLGQFGCRRTKKGIETYFSDVLELCRKYKINRLAYAYREQWWQQMNYELNPSALSVIIEDFEKTNRSMPLSVHLIKFRQVKSIDTEWLNYNPFYFQIQENQKKSAQRRLKLQINIALQGEIEQMQPVFIVGCGRSGTTFLLKCLSFAEDALCLHEPLSFWLELFPQLNIWSYQEKQILRADQKFYDQHLPEVEKLKIIYTILLKETQKSFIVDKQPENVFKLFFLKKCFPKMKVLYIQRGMQAVQNSISHFTPEEWYGKDTIKFKILCKQALDQRAALNQSYIDNYSKAKLEWKESKTAFLEFKAAQESDYIARNICELTFEKLMQSPQQTLRQAARFLSINHKQTINILQGAAKLIIKH